MPDVGVFLTWLKACFQLWEQTNPETSLCHISSSWPCPIACADYSAMPIGNLSGCHHTVDTENTNMHAQHSRGQASTIVHASSCFHYITRLTSPIHIAFLASSTTRLQWHWYQMEDADTQSSTAARLSRHCHHAQDYRQRIWNIRKATKHSSRCEYGNLPSNVSGFSIVSRCRCTDLFFIAVVWVSDLLEHEVSVWSVQN